MMSMSTQDTPKYRNYYTDSMFDNSRGVHDPFFSYILRHTKVVFLNILTFQYQIYSFEIHVAVNPFVFSDAATLREKHRIIGAMMGCLPRCPHQNSQLGLPLKLLNEEVALLVKKG